MSSLRAKRLEVGIKAVIVAQLLGIDPGRLSRIEAGQIQPRPGEIDRIRQMLERLDALRREFWFADFGNLILLRNLLDGQSAKESADEEGQPLPNPGPVKVRRTEAGFERFEGDAWVAVSDAEVENLRRSGVVVLWNPEERPDGSKT